MSCPAVEILMELRDLLAEDNQLAHKRAIKAAQQARYRAKVRAAATAVDTTQHVDTTKEREAERETFPPAPPIERKGKGKKTTTTATRAPARTREGCSYVGPIWEEVLKYVNHTRVKIDPDYALWWYDQMSAMGWCNPADITKPLGNWKAMLRVWWGRRAKDSDEWRKQKENAPKTYPREDWILCEERCQHFDAQTCRCRCGCTVPPIKRAYPLAPEECVRFHTKTS